MSDQIERMGQQIGDYYLLTHLGGGGLGEVYLSKHIRTQEQVAIKVLHGRLTDKSESEEFFNEARAFRLQHPHIMPLLDFSMTDDASPYLVMEYAPYGNLRDRHPKGIRVPITTVVSYVTPLAEALFYAHKQHLIHRNIKPENMLLVADNRLQLSDFGITAVARNSHLTNVQRGMGGTLPYMAPEQLQGNPIPASDQYALAIVTYEWLTGVQPFRGTQAELITQHMIVPPSPLQKYVSELPAEVEEVVLIALAKDPKARFATVHAFAHALAQAIEPTRVTNPIPPQPVSDMLPITLLPPASSITEQSNFMIHENSASSFVEKTNNITSSSFPSTKASKRVEAILPIDTSTGASTSFPTTAFRTFSTRSPRVVRQRKKVLAPSIMLLVVLLIASIGIFWTTNTINSQHSWATATARGSTATGRAISTATVSALQTTTASENPQLNPYDRYVTTNGMMFGFDAQHTHVNPFEQALNPTTVSSLHMEWSSLTRGLIVDSPAVVNAVIYVGSWDGSLYAIEASNGIKKWRFPTDGAEIDSSPAVANGVVYVSSIDQNLYAIDAATGKQRWRFFTDGIINASAYSSPVVVNSVVYVGSTNGNLYALDATTGTKKWSFPTGGISYSSPAVADGVVYVGSGDRSLYAIDAVTGKQKWRFLTGGSIADSPAVVNDIVYVGSNDGYLYAIDATKGTKKWSFHIGGFIDSSPAIAGGVVYIGSENKILYAVDASTGKQKWRFPTGNAVVSSPTVADGVVYVGSFDHNLYAIDAITGKQKWLFPTGGAITSDPAVAYGGVYVGSEDGYLYAFRLPS